MNITNLLDGWYRKQYINHIGRHINVDFYVPCSCEGPGGQEAVHGFLAKYGNEVSYIGNYDSTDGWEVIDSFEAHQRIIIENGPYWDRSLRCIGEDAENLAKVKEIALDKMREQFGGVPIPDEDELERRKETQNKCSHPSLEKITHRSEFLDQSCVLCGLCGKPDGIKYRGKLRSLQKLIDPDWILEDFSTYTDLYDIEGKRNDFVIYSRFGEKTRLDRTTDLFSFEGRLLHRQFTHYNWEEESVLGYVRDEEFVGFLTWDKIDGQDALYQIYVRPSYRRKGIATQLVKTWSDNIREDEIYLLDTPNRESLEIFKKMGHLNSEHSPQGLQTCKFPSMQFFD